MDYIHISSKTDKKNIITRDSSAFSSAGAFIQDFYSPPGPQVRYPALRAGLFPGTAAASDGGSTSVSGLETLFPGRTAPISSSAESGLPEGNLNISTRN